MNDDDELGMGPGGELTTFEQQEAEFAALFDEVSEFLDEEA